MMTGQRLGIAVGLRWHAHPVRMGHVDVVRTANELPDTARRRRSRLDGAELRADTDSDSNPDSAFYRQENHAL